MPQWKAFVRDTLIFTCLLMVVKVVISREFTFVIAVESLLTAVLSNILLFTFGRRIIGSLATKLKESIPPVDLEEGEETILEEGADHFRGIEHVGGRLVLTNRRLIFTSHKININNHSEAIPVGDIIFVSKDDHLSPYQMKIMLVNSDVHKFRVTSPERWVEAISAYAQSSGNHKL